MITQTCMHIRISKNKLIPIFFFKFLTLRVTKLNFVYTQHSPQQPTLQISNVGDNGVIMLNILLLYFVVQGAGAVSSWECIALDGERIPNGETYVPGPDYCTVCKCDEGKPRVCQAVLCQPPQDCKSFRLGRTCCDFICLDNMLPHLPGGGGNNPSTDLGLRMVASAVTAILSLALLLFLIHRLRQRRIRAQQQYYEDQLDSPSGPNPDSCHNNACCHNAAYCNGNDHVDLFLDGHTPPYSLWKPPSFYFSHEDAPPPYSEVVGRSYRLPEASNSLPSLGPLMVQLGPPPGESSDNNGGALALIGAIGGSFRRPCSSSHAPHNVASEGAKGGQITLRSDEVYEDADGIPDDLPPPYYPPVQPLNDLNRGTEVRVVGETLPTCNNARGSVTAASQECACGAEDPSCSLCAPPAPTTSRNEETMHQQPSTPPRRLRSREHRSSLVQREGERTSTLEEFQLCLAMDISDSSISSDVPTRTFSSSSEDSTSMDTTSEMR
nr:integral membrane protein DGCR2/IDD-like isoform X2 [Cherax quadricarinatus]